MSMEIVLILVWMHFVADFVFQTDEVAINKSKSNLVLAKHVAIYTAPFLVFGWQFAAITYALHFVTDWVSSRATSKLYAAGHRHWFFVVIGLDQALHMSALFLAYLAINP